MPQESLSASRSGDNAAWALLGLANRLNSDKPATAAPPLYKPVEIKSRLVIGLR